MLNAILNIVLKTYLARNENLRIPMLLQLIVKSDNYLKIYYKNLMTLINSKDETRKIIMKTSVGKNLDGKKNARQNWKISDEISEKEEDSFDNKDEVIKKINFNVNGKEKEGSEKNLNLLISKGFETVNKKSILFLLDEFFILYLKHIMCLGLLEKKYVLYI